MKYAEEGGFEARAQNYTQLASSVDIHDINISIIRRALSGNYHKHPAALKKYL